MTYTQSAQTSSRRPHSPAIDFLPPPAAFQLPPPRPPLLRGRLLAISEQTTLVEFTTAPEKLVAMATCYPSYELSPSAVPQQPTPPRSVGVVPTIQKDYSRPLHVDCSVEYELPNQAKPPVGVRNEPLLMIHPCYFRKIESQRRSPFVNNLPTRQPPSTGAVPTSSKRRVMRGSQIPQQVPQQAAQYPVQYAERQQQPLWDSLPPLVPITTTQTSYCKRDNLLSGCGATAYSSGSDSGHWTDPDRSPDRPDDKHILTGKYRQYLRAHRLHPYGSSIPIASTFPQIHQVCYNV